MVEILNIPLDFDEEFANDEHKSLSIDQPVHDRSSAEREPQDSINEPLMMRRSSSFGKLSSLSDGYTNDFLMTKEILRKIIKIETEHIDCFKNRAAGVIKKASKVQTLNIDGRVCAEYQKLYVEYK